MPGIAIERVRLLAAVLRERRGLAGEAGGSRRPPAGGVPVFSPDSRQVAFNRGRDLYVVAARGGRARRVARGFLLTGPSWARAR